MHKNQVNMDNSILLNGVRQSYAFPSTSKNQFFIFQGINSPHRILFAHQQHSRQTPNVNTVKESIHFQSVLNSPQDQKRASKKYQKLQESVAGGLREASNKMGSPMTKNLFQKVVTPIKDKYFIAKKRQQNLKIGRNAALVKKDDISQNVLQRDRKSSNKTSKYRLTINYCNPGHYHSVNEASQLQSFQQENKQQRSKRVNSINNIFSDFLQQNQNKRWCGNANKMYSPQFQANKKANFTYLEKQIKIKQAKRSFLKEVVSHASISEKERISQPNLNKYWQNIKNEQQASRKSGKNTELQEKQQVKSKGSSFKQIKSIQLDEVKKIIQDPFQFLSPHSRKTVIQMKSSDVKYKLFSSKIYDQKYKLQKYSEKGNNFSTGKPSQKRIGSPKLNKIYLNAKKIERNLIQKSRKMSFQRQQKKSANNFFIKRVRSSDKVLFFKDLKDSTSSNGFCNNHLLSVKDNKSYCAKEFSITQKRPNITERHCIKKIGSSPNFLSQFNIKAQMSNKSKQQQSLNTNENQDSSITSNKKDDTHVSTYFEGDNTDHSGKSMSIGKNSQTINKILLYPIKSSAQLFQKAQQFILLKKLAENVSVAIHVKSNAVFCLKQLSLTKQSINEVANQYKVLSYLQHTNIGRVYGAFSELQNKHPFFQIVSEDQQLKQVKKVYILLEYLQDLTLKHQNQMFLSNFIHRNQKYAQMQESLKYQDQRKCKRIYYFLQQTAHALKLIHKKDVIHRDLKPLNIFLSNKIYKIGDFGSATFTKSQEHIGTLDYAAPQILLKGQYDKSIDIWSLGCILYEMYTGLPPFYHQKRQKTFQNAINTKYNQKLVKNQNLRKLIGSMLRLNPNQRIKIQQILKHPFCQEYKKLMNKSFQG